MTIKPTVRLCRHLNSEDTKCPNSEEHVIQRAKDILAVGSSDIYLKIKGDAIEEADEICSGCTQFESVTG